ncbi:MAG: SAF domain-containing protein [Acidobacteriota bacterium]
MSRRRRVVALLGMAGVAAVLGIAMISRYSSSVARSYGELRPVIVVTEAVPAGRLISPEMASRLLSVRKVPARFVPAAAIARPERAVGLETVGPMPAGSYLTGNALRPPQKPEPARPDPGRGRHPVEIAVSGAGALTGTRGPVDVLVTSEPGPGGHGGTTVAASRVPLISVEPAGNSDAGAGLTRVTLGLTRSQAVRLVGAESYARRITVLPGKGGGG